MEIGKGRTACEDPEWAEIKFSFFFAEKKAPSPVRQQPVESGLGLTTILTRDEVINPSKYPTVRRKE